MKNEKKQGPRERVLETAMRLFHKQGYNSTGINQIIREASVAKASLYEHFQSKEDLAVAYLDRRHLFWFDKLKAHVEKASGDKVYATFDFISLMNRDENYRGCSFLNILSEISENDTAILQLIQAHKQDLRDFFREMLPGRDDREVDAAYLLFESAITESRLYKQDWPVVRACEILQLLLEK